MKPGAVATEDDHYRVGVSPIWRTGKKVLGVYLPWWFGNGEPFHAGLAWEAMDLGLKVMSTSWLIDPEAWGKVPLTLAP